MVAKFFGKFKTAKKPKDPKNGAAPSKTKPIKSKMKPLPNPKSESLATPTGTPRSTRATPNPAGSATNGKPRKPKPKITLPIIISIILGVIILLMVIAAVLYFVLKSSDNENETPVCKTPQCISLAHQLLNWRDEKVDPCDDFHQFTCGKYTEQVNSEQNALAWKSMLVAGTIAEHINKIKQPKRKAELAMKAVLRNCEKSLREGFWDQKSIDDLFSKIDDVGKFPILDATFNEAEFEASKYLDRMAAVFKSHHFGLFQLEFEPRLAIMPDAFSYFDWESTATILKRKGLPAPLIDYWKPIISQFSIALRYFENPVSLPRKTTINDLAVKFANVNFEPILKSSMTAKQYQYASGNLLISPTFETSSFGSLDAVVANSNKTMLANFLLFVIINNANREMIPITGCQWKIAELTPHLALGVMIRHYFDKKNLEKVSGIIDEMRVAFQKMLVESTWLQESTKKNAVKKLETLKKVIGYTEEYQDPEKFEKIFENQFDYKSTDSKYVLCLKLVKFTRSMMFEELTSGRLMVTFDAIVSVNAFYSPLSNMIMLTVPIMDDPFFDASFPKYAQIGSIGYVVGHEIGHAFDPKGSKYDEKGNYRNWWTTEDQAEFKRRTQCVINKYENFDDPVFGRNQLNGTIASGENVADLLGARVSWDILKNVDVSKEQKLAGFEDYSIDKLFFQILAMKYCSPHYTYPLMVYNNDPHAPNNYRVNGVFSNMKQFAETFDCPVGSKMNPATKCDLF